MTSGYRSRGLPLYKQSGAASSGHYQQRYQRNGRPTAVTLVLEYIKRIGVLVLTPMEVRSWAREAYGLDVDRRRIHDAFRKLERAGILQRIRRGVYRVVNLAKALAELAKRLTSSRIATESYCYPVATRQQRRVGSCAAGRGRRGAGRVVGAGDGCWVVARWHRRTWRGSPLDWLVGLFLSLGVVEGFARCARRRIRGLLQRAGFSKYRLRRLGSRVRELVKKLCSCEFRVGAHGAGNGEFFEWDRLVKLAMGLEKPWLVFHEFGVDVVCCGSDGAGLERFVNELREAMGSQMVYVPLKGVGSRRH